MLESLVYGVQGDTLYLFFETMDPITSQGDIGVAESIDKGATWKPLGIALDEAWHLSFPFVFNYNGEVRYRFLYAIGTLMMIKYANFLAYLFVSIDIHDAGE